MADEEEVARLRIDARGVVRDLDAVEKQLRQVFQVGQQLEKQFSTAFGKNGGLAGLNKGLKSLSALTRTIGSGGAEAQLGIARSQRASNQVKGAFADPGVSATLQTEREISKVLKAREATQRQLFTQQRTAGLDRIRNIDNIKEAEMRLEAAQRRQLLNLNKTDKSRREEEQRVIALRRRVEDLTRAEKERLAVIKRGEVRSGQLGRLNEEIEFRRTPQGQATSQAAGNLAQQNRLSSVLGDGGASLLAVQARIMANFAVLSATMRSFTFLTGFVVDLDREFKQLQAITASTDGEMITLRDRLIEVSEVTKFTAVEVAQAATVLGQAGFSTRDISESIEGITLFASAVGTDLKTAVDLTTSAMSVFNLQASETGRAADVMTAAINNSKLTVEKLNLGLSFASNIAAQNNVQFTELVTVLASLANSGIRNGSTLGTGLRQLLIDLANPTEKLIENLRRVGLTTEDVNIRTQGLIPALNNLRRAGFGVTEAMASFEVRSAAAFSAISNQLPEIDRLGAAILTVGAAAAANDTQMEALSNKWLRFTSVVGSFGNNVGGPIVTVLKGIVDGMSSLFESLNEVSDILSIIGPLLIGVGTAFAAISLAKTASRLFSYVSLFTEIRTEAVKTSVVLGGLASRGGFALFAARLLGMINPIGLAITLATGLGAIFLSTGEKASTLNDELDAARTSLSAITDRYNSLQDSLRSVDTAIADLSRKSVNLDEDQTSLAQTTSDLGERFINLGKFVGETADSTGELIDRLRELRLLNTDNLLADIGLKIAGTNRLIGAESGQLGKSFGTAALADLFQSGQASKFGLNLRGTSTSSGVAAFGGAAGAREASIAEAISSGQFKIEGIENLPDEIRRAFESVIDINQNRPEFLGREIVDEDLGDIQAFQTKLSKTISNIISLSRENSGEFNPLLEALEASLVEQKQIVSRIGISVVENRQARTDQRNTRFQQTGLFSDISGDLIEKRSELSARRKSIQLDVINGETSAIDAVRLVESEIELIKEFSKGARQKAVDAGKASEFDATLATSIAEFQGEAFTLLEETIDSISDEAQRTLISEQNRIKREKSEQFGRFDKNATRSEIKDAQETINGLLNDELRAGLERIEVELSNKDITDRESNERIEDLKAGIDSQRRALAEKTEDALSATRGVVDSVDSFVKEIAQEMKLIDKRFQQAQTRAGGALFQNQLQLDSASLKINSRSISGVQVEDVRRNREDLVTQQLRDTIDNETRRLDERNVLLSKLQNQRGRSTSLVSSLRAESTGGDISAARKDTIDETVRSEETKLANIDGKIRELQTEAETIALRLNQANLEYVSRTEAQIAQPIGQVLGNAIEQWTDEVGAFEDLTKTIADNAKGFFTDVSNSLADSIVGMVDGTKSVSEAARQMASEVISSLLRIAAQKAAVSFAGAALSGFSGIGIKSGGLIEDHGVKRFARGGSVMGPVKNRDSVPALLQPGEFVLKKSAVDAVGKDFLFGLNSTTSSRVSEAGNDISQQPSSSSGKTGDINVWVVPAEQVPPPGPNDIIATVADNISQNGIIRKRIASISR